MNRTILFSICISCAAPFAAAQPPVAPTPVAAGGSAERNSGNYNVINNFELGYRFHTVGGSENQYRSSVNYSNGVRLLGSSLMVNSRDGRGNLFDQIVLTTQGLGNDPYQNAQLRIERNGAYRYDMNWRENQYFNPGLLTSGGNRNRGSNSFSATLAARSSAPPIPLKISAYNGRRVSFPMNLPTCAAAGTSIASAMNLVWLVSV